MKVFVLFNFMYEKKRVCKKTYTLFYIINFLKSSSLPLNTVMWRYSPLS